MATRSILASYNKSIREIDNLIVYISNSSTLDSKFQYLIGEVVMLRLFGILESTFSDIAFKIACGAKYANGRSPVLLLRCNSTQHAYQSMLNYNRSSPKKYLKWTTIPYIKDSIEKIIDLNDPFYLELQNYSNEINEMRIVRNHIAHRTKSTKIKYNNLLFKKYSAKVKLTIGAFLMSTKRHSIANIDYFIRTSKIILNDITRG